MDKMKRLCIYLTYDKQKIVDKYIGYMLKELKTCAEYLIVVCNETEIVRGQDLLEEYADEIFYRENIGFDAGGYKDALCDFIGWDKVLEYDELVLANDSMFGPFKPMKSIFAEMEERAVDFWGLAKHGECESRQAGYIPEHIQSYFIVVGNRMLHCDHFREYWEKMPYFRTFDETVRRHEMKFTGYFAGLGYTFDSLADTEKNDSKNRENNYSQYSTLSFELIKKRNFPFLKKQQIALDTLEFQTQENLRQAIDYIDQKTDYDVNLVWENIIRTLNMADLQRSLHLQYIISQEEKKPVHGKVMIAVFASYGESAEYVREYIEGLYMDYSVRVFSENKKCLEAYREQRVQCEEIQLDKIIELLAAFRDFDYVGILHDADMSSDTMPSCIVKSYFYHIWENLAKNKAHVSGILELFAANPHLGFLAPPQPNFAQYFEECGKGWDGKFEAVQCITKELLPGCQISEQKAPFRITENFWIRGCILGKLQEMAAKDAPCLPYLWSYLAQDAGYYSGIVESADYAAMDEVNMRYYLDQVASKVRRQYGSFGSFAEMKEKMSLGALCVFCRKYPRILVYGAGEMAKKYRSLMPVIEAYVVSDGRAKPKELGGIPVKYLSEICAPDNCGMVLCINEKNQKQVIPLLEERGIENYFCM